MRALALIPFIVACAANAPRVAKYDLDAHTMVPIVYAATHAQNYRVAVIDPKSDSARFVMMPKQGGSPLVVHVAAQTDTTRRFATCIGSCSTSVWVSSDSTDARELMNAIDARAQSARLDH